MKSVEDLTREIIAREGGYVDDPADPGGATKFGVTVGTLRRLGVDLTGDGRTDAADVRALTPDRAAEIYLEHYFRRPRLAELPKALRPTVYDMYVNAGSNAIKLLQSLLNALGNGLTVDGAIGPATLSAADRASAVDAGLLADAYGIERRSYYYRLGDARPGLRKFARRKDGGKGGWIIRAEEFLSDRFRLTEAQHRERTAKWG